MTPIVLKLFVTTNQENSGAPGSSAKSVGLTHVKGPNAATKGPNAALFENEQGGQITLNLNGVTAEVKAALAGGKAIKVTIEDDQ